MVAVVVVLVVCSPIRPGESRCPPPLLKQRGKQLPNYIKTS